MSRIHIDAIGGLAGDMFVAALVDALPIYADPLLETLRGLPLPEEVAISLDAGCSGIYAGRRFRVAMRDAVAVTDQRDAFLRHGADREHRSSHSDAHGDHQHRRHQDIQSWIEGTSLTPEVKAHARAMFAILAEAEARVHGIPAEEVTFHEVGAWDSIVDFVAAAWLIDTHRPERWTCSPLPLGSGRIRTAHGILPLPAPATTVLLTGMEVVDDGIPGERVTPTGATIVKYLATLSPSPQKHRPLATEVVAATGVGLGTRELAGVSNAARCIVFTRVPSKSTMIHEEIATIQFEVDDQSPEDLALALDRIRQCPGVLEVYQAPLYGKKGRLAAQIQILAEVPALDAAADLCFEETTTLGLRTSRVLRRKLPRHSSSIQAPRPLRVKVARRPSGRATVKAEMDDLASEPDGHVGRQRTRSRAQGKSFEGWKEIDGDP